MTTRRRFISLVPVLGVVAPALAQAAALVDPKDPQAQSLGYAADATKIDKSRYAKYAPGQSCANCALYQGAAGSATGVCPIYGGKSVPAKAWCNAWVKKA